MPYFLLSLLIFVTPFVINPFGDYFFEPPKVVFVQILVELLLAFFLFGKVNWRNFNHFQLILSAILFILTLFQLFLLSIPHSFFGNEVRLQGIFLLWHLIALSLVGSRLDVSQLPKVLFPVCLFFLLLSSFLVEPDTNGRAIGTLGEANALASSAIFYWPLALVLKLKDRDKILKSGILFTALIIILLSGSRSGMLAFLIQIIFILICKWLGLKKAVILSFLFILFSLTLPFIQGGGWFENRAEIWQTAIFAGSGEILGNAFGNIEQALFEASEKLNNNVRFQAVDSAHNFLLDFWVQGGIIGLSVVVLLIFLSLRRLIKNKKTLELAAFLGLITVLLFNPASVATLVVFWFLIGQGFKGIHYNWPKV